MDFSSAGEIVNSFPQCGRALNGASSFSMTGSNFLTAGQSCFQEVNGDARLLVAGAHPKIVRSNGADFCNQQMWAHLFMESLNSQNGFNGVMARHKIL